MADSGVRSILNTQSGKILTETKSAHPGHSLQLGIVSYFGDKGPINDDLLSGWSAPEPEHNWNDGCETVLQTLVKDPGGPCIIEIQGEPFINDKCPRQDVILHLNGFRIGYWRLTKAMPCTLTARFEKEQLFQRDGEMLVKLAWSFPDSVSPIARDLSNDTRELAFCFRSVLISKIEEN